MVKQAVKNSPKIEAVSYDGLIANSIGDFGATVIIRGLRALSDFDYEFQMAFTNRQINEKAETIFLMPSAKYVYLNSTMVKEIAKLGGDVSGFVPAHVMKKLLKKLRN